ncbi:MAG: xanthine dehydrogenase subunit D, partial [Acidimicrobiales bacterium]
TLRSEHSAARVISLDISKALALPGVYAVLTHDDVPGEKNFGLDFLDQPVLVTDTVRYVGEAIAVVAADHPETARLAVEAIEVTYELLEPLVDAALAKSSPDIHPDGNVVRELTIRRGEADLTNAVMVEGSYEVGMQDQAFLGPESALAVPSEDGGVELHLATQWLHSDYWQVAASLGLPEDKVRLTLAGVGGAFGGREDVSMQVHICMLALHTGRPVKMVYSREESFYGHVHRHPAKMKYRHYADRQGNLLRVEAEIVLDGGAYISSSPAVISNAVSFCAGPYRIPSVELYGIVARTNNPPCGAMRGFGAVQTCYGHESQMDRLAEALKMDPVELRIQNAIAPGDLLPTGQRVTGTAPVAEVIRAAVAHDLPPALNGTTDLMALPGGAGGTTSVEQTRRGVGFAVGFKNLMFSEGYDDFSVAAVTLRSDKAIVKSACAEVGQGFVTLAQQITRSVLGVDEVELDSVDTEIASAGSTSASRQTWMSGGAVEMACEKVREKLFVMAAEDSGLDAGDFTLVDGVVSGPGFEKTLSEILGEDTITAEVEHHHEPTQPLDENGQGDAHVSFAFAAHRAVVDVDPELGLVRLQHLSMAQDVGVVLNPVAVVGQLEGGTAQGIGLALMEEILLEDGLVKNPSFTDYLIPTSLDMPDVAMTIIEEPEPGAPLGGAKGIGEPPTISSGPAVLSAIRAATGYQLSRVPVRPSDIAFYDAESG